MWQLFKYINIHTITRSDEKTIEIDFSITPPQKKCYIIEHHVFSAHEETPVSVNTRISSFNPLIASVALMQEPVNWFAVQINWLVSIWGQHWQLMGQRLSNIEHLSGHLHKSEISHIGSTLFAVEIVVKHPNISMV